MRSWLRLAGLMSVYCDWVRLQNWCAPSDLSVAACLNVLDLSLRYMLCNAGMINSEENDPSVQVVFHYIFTAKLSSWFAVHIICSFVVCVLSAVSIIIIIIIIINLIYIAQFDTNGILTALYIVITYIQMQYVHVCAYAEQSYKYTYTCLHIHTYTVTCTNIHLPTY